MKWFKTESDLSNQVWVQELEDKFGLEAYARLLKLREYVARDMDETNRDYAEHSWINWQTFLKGKKNKLVLFLEHLQNIGEIFLEQNGNILKIKYPKMLKLRDNHTKNLQAKNIDKDIDSKKEELDKSNSSKETGFPEKESPEKQKNNDSPPIPRRRPKPPQPDWQKDGKFIELRSIWPPCTNQDLPHPAYEKYLNALKIEGVDHEVIFTGARKYADSRANEDAQYTKTLRRWLAERGWESSPQARSSSKSKATEFSRQTCFSDYLLPRPGFRDDEKEGHGRDFVEMRLVNEDIQFEAG